MTSPEMPPVRYPPQAYMKTRQLAHFPAGVPVRKIRKKDLQGAAAYETEQATAWAQGETVMRTILAAGARADAAAMADELKGRPKLRTNAAQKLSARIAVYLVHCPRCGEGTLKAAKITGKAKKIVRAEIAVQPIDRMASRDLLQRLAKR